MHTKQENLSGNRPHSPSSTNFMKGKKKYLTRKKGKNFHPTFEPGTSTWHSGQGPQHCTTDAHVHNMISGHHSLATMVPQVAAL